MIPKYVKAASRVVVRTVGQGFLEVYASPLGEMPVVHVMGSPIDMGRQYGALVGDTIAKNVALTYELFEKLGVAPELKARILDAAWRRLAPHTPERYIVEMEATVQGAQAAGFQVTLADMQRLTAVTNFDLYKREEWLRELLADEGRAASQTLAGMARLSCTMFAVWGSRTQDGKMFALRNLDWNSQTGGDACRLITAYSPEDRAPFVTMGYGGVIGALAGMNEYGVSISEVGAFCASERLDGTPWVFMARRILEESYSLEDAVAIVRETKHTLGYNYLVAFGDPERFGLPGFRPRAAAFETNFTSCETFLDNDSKEHAAQWRDANGAAHRYGLPMTEAVMRADTAFAPATRAAQAADNGPGNPDNDGNLFKEFECNSYLECHKPMHDMIRAYETGAEYVFPVRGTKAIEAGTPRKIGHEEALTIAATVAHNTEKLHLNDWDTMSVVYAPTDLDFWVAYESCDAAGNWTNAPDSGYWQFNVAELVQAAPHD